MMRQDKQDVVDRNHRLQTLLWIRSKILQRKGPEAILNYKTVTWVKPDGSKTTKKFSKYDGMEILFEEILTDGGVPHYFYVTHNGKKFTVEPEWYRDHVAAELASRKMPLNPPWVLPLRFGEYMDMEDAIEVHVHNIFEESD